MQIDGDSQVVEERVANHVDAAIIHSQQLFGPGLGNNLDTVAFNVQPQFSADRVNIQFDAPLLGADSVVVLLGDGTREDLLVRRIRKPIST